MNIHKRWIRSALVASAALAAFGGVVGCDRDDATDAGKKPDVVDKAGDAANRGINAAGDAGREAVQETKDAANAGRAAVGRAAEKSGAAADQAGHAVKEWVAPATNPATRPATAPTTGVPGADQ